jgi:signal recognition particle GTPase
VSETEGALMARRWRRIYTWVFDLVPRQQDFTLRHLRGQSEVIRKLLLQFQESKRWLVPSEVGLEEAVSHMEGIIDAMTPDERDDPDLVDAQRCLRIAARSGTEPCEVRTFLSGFRAIRELMRQRSHMTLWQRLKWACGWRGPAGPSHSHR